MVEMKLFAKQKQRHRRRERCVDSGEWGELGDGTDKCTTPCVRQMTRGSLLNSTGRWAQGSEAA